MASQATALTARPAPRSSGVRDSGRHRTTAAGYLFAAPYLLIFTAFLALQRYFKPGIATTGIKG
jgi:ABC-type maltose transport system permease subunit